MSFFTHPSVLVALAGDKEPQRQPVRTLEMATASDGEFILIEMGADDWQRIEDGPRGGKRWKHKVTGKVAYKAPGGAKAAGGAKKPAGSRARVVRGLTPAQQQKAEDAKVIAALAGKKDGLYKIQGGAGERVYQVAGGKAKVLTEKQAAALAKKAAKKPPAAKKPAVKKKPTAPRKPVADHGGTVDAAVAMYKAADDTPDADIDAMGERLKTLPKAALLKVAAGLNYIGGERVSAAKLADALYQRIKGRRGAAQRVALINRDHRRPADTRSLVDTDAPPMEQARQAERAYNAPGHPDDLKTGWPAVPRGDGQTRLYKKEYAAPLKDQQKARAILKEAGKVDYKKGSPRVGDLARALVEGTGCTPTEAYRQIIRWHQDDAITLQVQSNQDADWSITHGGFVSNAGVLGYFQLNPDAPQKTPEKKVTANGIDPDSATPAERRKEWERSTAAGQRMHGEVGNNPRGYEGMPEGIDAEKFTRDAAEFVRTAKKKSSLTRPTLKQMYAHMAERHPGLTIRQFQQGMTQLHKDKRVTLGAYTLASGAVKDDDLPHTFPLDKEQKFYVDDGPNIDKA